MSKRIAFAVVVFALGISASSAEAACSVTYSFTNGTPADAGQVNTNFSDLASGCAPLASPSFTGTVGIGMTAGDPLGITNNQNGQTRAYILNNSGGGGAIAMFRTDNGTSITDFGTTGTGNSGVGGLAANEGYAYNSGVAGMLVGANATLVFTSGGLTERGRFGTDGSFLVNTTANGGWSSNAQMESVASGKALAGSFYNVSTLGGFAAIGARVDNTAVAFENFYFSTTGVGSISFNGTITVYNTSSDERLKTNVVDLPAEKADRALRAYHPQEYLLRGKPGVGALAQEVDRRFSSAGLDAAQMGLVTRGDFKISLREGQPGFRQWQMDGSKMVPFLVEVGIDHADRIRALETQNALLSRQIEGLLKTVANLEHAKNSRIAGQGESSGGKHQAR